jgi:hypothetical protein
MGLGVFAADDSTFVLEREQGYPMARRVRSRHGVLSGVAGLAVGRHDPTCLILLDDAERTCWSSGRRRPTRG